MREPYIKLSDLHVGMAVKFVGRGGYDWQRKSALKLLTIDSIYYIESFDINSYDTTICLKEFGPQRFFNESMFTYA